MAEYRVIWEIDVEGETPAEAAIAAFRAMRDPESCATVFSVVSAGPVVQVDLAALSEQVQGEMQAAPMFADEISRTLRRLCDAAVAAENAAG